MSGITPVYAQSVNIEYFYQAGCHDCEITNPLINQIKKQYENIIVIKTDVSTTEGFNRWNQYGFLEVPAVVINNETKISKEEITEEKLKVAIDNHFRGEETDNQHINSTLNIPFAYSLGLFAGMSPCLMAILGFLLSLTAGTNSSVKNGMTKTGMAFFDLLCLLTSGIIYVIFIDYGHNIRLKFGDYS
ncbi:thioredoxin family protein [Methanolobus sp. WCC5]|uniref:thioredoxin family protein n=1 Tax=Methanolobus sp. WCC5 TaxID=3125785 RepID=UPI00325596D9